MTDCESHMDYSRKTPKLLGLFNVVRHMAITLVTWRWFERFSILVIILNCVCLGLVDPCDDKCKRRLCKSLQYVEHGIFSFFALEMIIKVIAMGLIGKESYLADAWNRFDCFIVLVGALEYAFTSQEINFSAIRAIRVLRPLRAINRISSLRLLVTLLLDIMPMLGNVLIFCFFLFFVFGIVAVQLWAGLLRQRCFFPKFNHDANGSEIQPPAFMPLYYRPPNNEFVCSTAFGALKCNRIPEFERSISMCSHLFTSNISQLETCSSWVSKYSECRPSGPNPARGTLSFDNIGYAWIVIFQIISLETWSEIMYLIQDAYSFWVWVYFVALIMLGAYLAVNLCLVVIATQFSETKAREREKMKKERLNKLKEDGFFSSGTPQSVSTLLTSGLYTQIISLIGHIFRTVLRRFCGVNCTRNKKADTFLVHCPVCRHIAKMSWLVRPGVSCQCQKCGYEMDVKSTIMQFPLRRRIVLSVLKNRALIRQFLQHNMATLFTMVAILINAIVMSLEHNGQPAELTLFIETMNLIFTAVFLVEILLKFYAYGPGDYFAEPFNALDAVIITINVAEVFSSEGGSGLAVLRLFRLFRLVKIIRFLPALQRQLLVMIQTIDHVATFFFLLSFFLYIASLLGMSLFGCKFCEPISLPQENANDEVNRLGMCHLMVTEWSSLNETLETISKSNGSINLAPESQQPVFNNSTENDANAVTVYRCSVTNFDSLFESLFTVLQVFTQDSWANVMHDGMHYTSDWAGIYFVILVTIGNYIIFNLLIAILVEAFSSMSDDDTVEFDLSGRESQLTRDMSSLELQDTYHDTTDKHWWNGVYYSFVRAFRVAKHIEHSLFLFPKERFPRRHLRRILSWKHYGKILLIVIVGSCALIVIERPGIKSSSVERQILTIGTYTFNVVFILEAIIKIIAQGFIIGQRSYLRCWWNVMDFVLVLLAIVDIALDLMPEHSDVVTTTLHEALRILCLFRALRPLRIITRAPGLQVVIKTLMVSIKPIGNIVLICCFFFAIWSILGVQLFSGCFSRCIIPSKQFSLGNFSDVFNESYARWAASAIDAVESRNDCQELGFYWYTERFNFDTLPNALMALFVFSTLDGWAAITNNGVACVGVDKQPIYGHNPWAYTYFISFLLIVCFFTLNMFVGVVVNNFQKVQKQVEARALRKIQELQAAALLNRLSAKVHPITKLSTKNINQTLLMASAGLISTIGMRIEDTPVDDEKEAEEEPDDEFWLIYPKWRLWIFTIFTHKYFELTVIAATCLNVLIMAAEFWNQPATMHFIITIIGYIFLAFVILEVVFKAIALGIRRYLSDRWNQLDALITFISIICVIFDEIDYLPINPALVRASRVFRIVRAFKLLKSASGLRHLMHTIGQAIPHVLHLSLLFFLLFFIYASLGVQLYGTFECTYDVCLGLSRHANFENFGMAMLTLFRIFTGDNWNEILKDVLTISNDPSRCNNGHNQNSNGIPCRVVHLVSPVYFISFVLLTQFVLINIVVAALLNQLHDPNNKQGGEAMNEAAIEADAIERVEKVEEMISEQCQYRIESLLKPNGSMPRLDIDDVVSIVSTEYVLQQPIANDRLVARPNTLSLFNSAPTLIEDGLDDGEVKEKAQLLPGVSFMGQISVTPPYNNAAFDPENIQMIEIRPRRSTGCSTDLSFLDPNTLKRAIDTFTEDMQHLASNSYHNRLTVGNATGSVATAYVELRRAQFKNRHAHSSASNCSLSPSSACRSSAAISPHSNHSINSMSGISENAATT